MADLLHYLQQVSHPFFFSSSLEAFQSCPDLARIRSYVKQLDVIPYCSLRC